MNKLRIISSPVTERYVRAGDEGQLSKDGKQIQVKGCWFDFDQRWKTQPIAVCFANHIGYSDVNPFEIISMHLNRKQIEIREMDTEELPWEKEFYVGGFFGHTANQHDQKWTITSNPAYETETIRLHKDGYWRDKHGRRFNLSEQARKFYDYNF